MRRAAPASGTSFTQTAIFTGPDYYRIGRGGPRGHLPCRSGPDALVPSHPSRSVRVDARSPDHTPWGPRDPGSCPSRWARCRIAAQAASRARSSSRWSGPTGTRTTSATRGGQGRHEGNDILAPKHSPVVAVEDGKIKFWTTSSRAGCMLYLYGASGTTYLYIHLNNDVTMANDNRGKCVAGGSYWPGLKDGAKVVAGQAIGFVGDSGDADGTPHLHFEVHPHDGGATNPFPFLNRATRILFTAPPGSAVTLSLKGTIVAASDTQLTMKVQTATVFPSRLKLLGLRKPMMLTLTPTALVDVPRARLRQRRRPGGSARRQAGDHPDVAGQDDASGAGGPRRRLLGRPRGAHDGVRATCGGASRRAARGSCPSASAGHRARASRDSRRGSGADPPAGGCAPGTRAGRRSPPRPP